MKRTALVLLLLLGATAASAHAADTFVVGVEQSTKASWQSLTADFQSVSGVAVSVQALPQNSIAQQVVLQAFTRSGRLNFVMVQNSWGSGLANYLQDLSNWAPNFSAKGITAISQNGKAVGVPIAFAPGWYLAVLTWPQNQTAAVDFLIAAALGSASGSSSATGAPSAQSVVSAFTTGKLSASQHSKKLDGAIESLIAAAQSTVSAMSAASVASLPSSALAALDTVASVFGVPFSPSTGTVTVVMESNPGKSASSNAAALRALGVSDSSIDTSSSLIKVTVPVGQLASLVAQLSGVAFVRAPYQPYTLGTLSEGRAAIHADVYGSAGVTGAGVRIAVIDLGFYGLAQAQARGDLPASVGQNDFTGTGLTSGISHGTAVAEVIYDIAPDAQLTLIKIGDEVDLDQAVTYCLANGIQIINHSLGWYNTSNYDGAGVIADIARRAVNGGILWINAAGNEAQNHWQGTFADGNSDGWNDSSVTFYASTGSPIVLYLTWNDWPAASTDYDLFLYDPASNLLASSTKYQTGTEEPTESIQTTASQSGTYTVRFRGTGSKSLTLYNLYQSLSPAVASSSILSPADVTEVVAVGAVNYANYSTGPQEPYSSQGPTTDGRTKPDLVCPDSVSTGTAPYTTFAGTSGAAPHAAGAAALLLSLQPSLSGAALRTQLLSQVVSMGSPNIYGLGRLVLQPLAPSNQAPVASFTYSPAPAYVGQSISFNGTGSHDPDGSVVSWSWNFGDGGTSSGSSTAHSFSSAGTFTVTLTVQDNAGATASTSQTVTVVAPANQPPVASFTATPSSALVGQTVTFNAGASYDTDGSIVYYGWAFGDSSTGTGAVTTHAYSAPGTYTATLTVQDNGGASSSTTRQVIVQIPTAPDLVVQSFTYAPLSPTVGQTLTFTIVVFNQGTATAGAFRIRLTGSSLSTAATTSSLAAGNSRTFSLTLPLTASSETYTVILDDLSQVAESNESNNTQTLTVTATTPAPVAHAGGPYAGTVGVALTFNGSASTGSITSYSWSFGDGGSALGSAVSRAYSFAGTYSVTLTVSGPGGSSSDTTQAVISSPQPALVASLSLPKSVYTIGEAVSITITVNRSAYVYLCEVAPDNRVVLLFPSIYEPNNVLSAGSRVIPGAAYTLLASAPTGSETLLLYAAAGPISGFPTSFGSGFPVLSTNPAAFQTSVLAAMQASYAATDRTAASTSFTVQAAAPTTGTLRVRSTPSGASVRVDGSSVGMTNLDIPNVAPGTHTVEISLSGYQTETRSATVTAGSTTTVQVTLTPVPANQAPTAGFTYSPTAPNAGTPVQFDASASADPDGTVISYAWSFGDGGTGVGALVTHAYSATGSYTVQLTVTDNGGATGHVSRLVTVSAPEVPPAMGTTGGIYVWGVTRWHVTVNADATWSNPRAYRVAISSDAPFTGLQQAVAGGASPLASLPGDGRDAVLAGTLGTGSIDFSFGTPNSTTLTLDLYLDENGDGTLERDALRVHLGASMVSPVVSSTFPPLLIGLPQFSSPPLTPSLNYRLGRVHATLDIILWVTDIRTLGG